MEGLERHDTHLLSCSSSVEHSYKFDKSGNIISDSQSEVAYSKIAKKNIKQMPLIYLKI